MGAPHARPSLIPPCRAGPIGDSSIRDATQRPLRLDVESQGDADEFDDILQNSNRSASIGRASLLVSLGGGLEYRFGDPGEDGGVRLGLRAGYVISALNSDWQLDEASLGGGPDATMQDPFIRLTLGGVGGTTSRPVVARAYRSASTGSRPPWTPPFSGLVHAA